MSTHRTDVPARRRRGRGRAVLALAAVAFLATGMSVQGTFAAFTDTATMSTGPFSSGTLDIVVNGQLAGPGTTNNPGTTPNTSFTMTNMSPGESVATSFPVRNNGSTGLRYNVTGTATGGLAVAGGMQYAVYFGSAATNTGTEANGNRTGACGAGNTPTDANGTTLTGTSTSLAADRTLAAGSAPETVCVVVRLNSTAGNALQGQTTSASLVFNARQLTAP
jgi:predicted ribosomally synthesized peptide with SipW-like signal peptide